MNFKKIFLAILIFLSFSTLANAAEITNVNIPSQAWITQTVNISYTCSNSTNPLSVTLDIKKLDPSQWESSLETTFVGEDFKASWNLPSKNNGPGVYRITLKCNDGGNLTTKFYDLVVRKLEFSQIVLKVAYSDEMETEVKAIINVNNGSDSFAVGAPSVSWKVISGGKDILKSSSSLIIDGIKTNLLTLDLLALDLQKNEENSVELSFEASYEGEKVIRNEILQTKDPATFLIKEKSVETSDDRKINLHVEEATYHNQTYILKTSDLELEFDGALLSPTYWSLEDLNLKISLPQKNPGKYSLLIKANINGIQEIQEIEVIYPVKVFGRVIGADGSPLSGLIIFSNPNIRKNIAVNQNGDYSASIISENYTVELLNFRGLKRAIFYGVSLQEDVENLISYDFLTSKNTALPGFKIAGGVAISFTLPFQSATLEIEYDDTAYPGLNEEKLKVLRCENWNFGQRICNKKWEEMENYDIFSSGPGGYIRLTVTSLSTFLIGEKDTLEIKFSLKPEKNEYYLKEDVSIEGMVVDSKGTGVKDVEVYYSWLGKEGKVKTNKDGIFTFLISMPSQAGNYQLQLFTQSETFENDRKSLNLKVVEKVEVSFNLPAGVKIPIGTNTTLQIKISNTGQKALNNLQIRLNGLNNLESYSPKTIPRLEVGEEKIVELQIVPQTAGARQIGISITNSELRKEDSFTILVSEVEVEKKVVETNQTSQPIIPIGKFIEVIKVPLVGLVNLIASNLIFLVLLISILIISLVFKNVKMKERKAKDNIILLGKSLQESFEKRDYGSVKGSFLREKRKGGLGENPFSSFKNKY